MRRKHSKTSPGWLVLIGGSESPESNWATTELSEPALQLRLCGIVGQSAKMKDLATFGKESTNVGSGVHWPSENFRMLMSRLGLADQTTKNSSQRNRLLHSTSRGGRSQCLQMEGKIVFNGSGRLHGLDFEGGTDIRQRTRTEWQRLGMMRLPPLVFGPKIKSARVLKVRRKHDSLVPSLPGQLDTKIPRIQSHKGEFEVLAEKMFLGEGVETVDGITEGTRRADVFPSQGSQARWGR